MQSLSKLLVGGELAMNIAIVAIYENGASPTIPTSGPPAFSS